MRWLSGLLVVLLGVAPVAAGPSPGSTPTTKKSKATKPTARTAKPPCKRTVVGRGLDRKVVYECTAAIDVRAGAPKPEVMIVPRDGRHVTGRPKSEDRLNGLSPRLER